MIDRKPAGEGNGFWKKTSDKVGDFQDQSGISSKAMVYLVIVALIIVLCIVYVGQLRKSRGGSPAADAAAAQTAETAAGAQTGETAAPAADAAAQEGATAEKSGDDKAKSDEKAEKSAEGEAQSGGENAEDEDAGE